MSDKKKMVHRVMAEPCKGLDSEQVKERLSNGFSNETVDKNSVTLKQIIIRNVFTYFNFIFLVLAILLVWVGAYRGLTFLPVILANIMIGIVQQVRSKKVLDKLNMLNAPKATLVRDGKKVTVDNKDAVLDDIACFEAGNQIYADAEVIDGEVQVNEALLTGEADEITKKAGDKLMSGSFVVSGECHARLTEVGDDSYIAGLSAQAKKAKKGESSKMLASINLLIKIVGILIIPIGIILFYEQHNMLGMNLTDSVSSMVAALLGMIPEGLYLLTSVALAISAMRLAKNKVLVHEMSCIETLARVNVLCVDKTGTITENTMKVHSFITLNGADDKSFKIAMSNFVAAMPKDNITMTALKEYFAIPATKRALRVMPFSPVYKFSGAEFSDASYIIGAPEFVLGDDYEKYKSIIEENSKKGFRVLVFGTYNGPIPKDGLKEAVSPLGLVLLRNPVRENAAETFRYFVEQGVCIKVISGDNPITVSEVAKEAEIENADLYIDASTLETDEEILDAAEKYVVFGRVTPEMKRRLVHALKSKKYTVAMTGDGVNDVLALKDADCSVAMKSGSEVAANVAQLVLLDSDFSSMPGVVLEGRRVVNNIERSASLFLVKNIFSLMMSVISMCFAISYPLDPAQVSLINMFTIGAPAFLLALEANKKMISGNFLTNVMLKALPSALTNTIIIGLLSGFGKIFNIERDVISTTATILMSAVGMIILYKISRPMNTYRIVVIASMIAGFILSCVFLQGLFGLESMNIQILLLLAVFSVAAVSILLLLSRLFEKIQHSVHNAREKRKH